MLTSGVLGQRYDDIVAALEREGVPVDKRCLPRKKQKEPFKLEGDAPAEEAKVEDAPIEAPAEPEAAPETEALTAKRLREILWGIPEETVICVDGCAVTSVEYSKVSWRVGKSGVDKLTLYSFQ